MGIKDTQYVIVRHHNTPNPHCHLIFNRVDNNGKRISDSNWLKGNVRVCKELKQKYGTTFKGSSLDRSLSYSKIDNVLTGGQAQDHSLTTDLSMLAVAPSPATAKSTRI